MVQIRLLILHIVGSANTIPTMFTAIIPPRWSPKVMVLKGVHWHVGVVPLLPRCLLISHLLPFSMNQLGSNATSVSLQVTELVSLFFHYDWQACVWRIVKEQQIRSISMLGTYSLFLSVESANTGKIGGWWEQMSQLMMMSFLLWDLFWAVLGEYWIG